MKPPDTVPGAAPVQWIKITSAIFDDGTFEGDADEAASYSAVRIGQKFQLGRIIELFEKQSDSADPEGHGFSELSSKIYALDNEPDKSALIELSSKYPSLSARSLEAINSGFNSGMWSAKYAAVRLLWQFEALSKSSPEKADFVTWKKQSLALFKSGN